MIRKHSKPRSGFIPRLSNSTRSHRLQGAVGWGKIQTSTRRELVIQWSQPNSEKKRSEMNNLAYTSNAARLSPASRVALKEGGTASGIMRDESSFKAVMQVMPSLWASCLMLSTWSATNVIQLAVKALQCRSRRTNRTEDDGLAVHAKGSPVAQIIVNYVASEIEARDDCSAA